MGQLLYHDIGSMRSSIGIFLVRVVVGAALAVHGWPKIQDPTGWMGPEPPYPTILVAAAAIAEFGGGLALIIGALTPISTFLIAATMFVAMFLVHIKAGDPFVAGPKGGRSYELAAVYLCAALGILLTGPGRLSIDALLFGKKPPSA